MPRLRSHPVPYRVPRADKRLYDLREFYPGSAQPSDMLGAIDDGMKRASQNGGALFIPEGYWEIGGPIVPYVGTQLQGVGTFDSTVVRGGKLSVGYGAGLSQIPVAAALGGGESWIALKNGVNSPLFMHDATNAAGKRGPAWGDSWAMHGRMQGIVLDYNGRNNLTDQHVVDMTNAAFWTFDDVRMVYARGVGFWLLNTNDVHGNNVYGIGDFENISLGTGDTHSSTTIDNVASGSAVIGDQIAGSGVVSGTYIKNITGAGPFTWTISVATTTTVAGVSLSRVTPVTTTHLAFMDHTTDNFWHNISMHAVKSESVLFANGGGVAGARGNVVEGFFGYAPINGGVNARFIEGAAHNQLSGRLDQARAHNARLDNTTHDNTLWVTAFGPGQWTPVGVGGETEGGWVSVFDDGKSNASYGVGAKGWSLTAGDINMIGVHRFGANASGHGVDAMSGGSDMSATLEKHRALGADGVGKSVVLPGAQPWSVPGPSFLPVSGSAATVVPHAGNARYKVLTFDRTIEQAAGYQFQVPRGVTGLVITFALLSQDATKTGVTMWDVEYSGYPSAGGNTPGAAEQAWSTNPSSGGVPFGKTITATNQIQAVIHPSRLTVSLFLTVPGEDAVLHIRRKAADAGDTLDAEVGLYSVRFEPIMLT